MLKKITFDPVVTTIFLVGLASRLLFSFWGSKFYYGQLTYTFGDSFSYTQSIINLIQIGTYSFDLSNPDAALYRGPTYPIFWGLHYLIFGDKAYLAVAVTQSILDVFSGFLIYLILQKAGYGKLTGVLGMTLYLITPTLLVHVPITGTETFGIFITLLVAYAAVSFKSKKGLFAIGVLCGIALMTRQYLGLLLPIAILYATSHGQKLISLRSTITASMITAGFLTVVSPWFLRNWINHDAPTVLMGKTTGYEAYNIDYLAFNRFYTLYFVDVTPIVKNIAVNGNDGLIYDEKIEKYSEELKEAAFLSKTCGSSFAQWRAYALNAPQELEINCNEEISKRYMDLRQRVLEEQGISRNIEVPLKNVGKALFKSELTKSAGDFKDKIINTVFMYRTALIALGLAAIFLIPRNRLKIFIIFPIALILYISFITRQVEIRYLAQADALLIIFSAISLYALLYKIPKMQRILE